MGWSKREGALSSRLLHRNATLWGHICAGIDLDEARRKREDNIIQLRKDKRDENLQKKRQIGSSLAMAESSDRPQSTIQQKVRRCRCSYKVVNVHFLTQVST